MALQVWITGTDGMKNLGLGGTRNLGSSTSNTNGKIGTCLKITTNYNSNCTLNPNTTDITMCGWFKFNLAELQTALNNSGYNSSRTTPTGNLLGQNSYGGLALCYQTNNLYASSGTINNISVYGAIRDSNSSSTCSALVIPFDTWTHVILTWNHVTKLIILYINGVLKSTATNAAITNITTWNFQINTNYVWGGNGPGKSIPLYFNDIKCYNNLLSEDEIHELSLGKVAHWCLDNAEIEPTVNLGNVNSNYSTLQEGTICNAGGWGGDTGTVTYYKHGGYNDGPYKVYHKLTTGSGGIYSKPNTDIVIEAGKTYTMSIYVKSNRDFTDSNYSFNINRTTDNHYITANSAVHFTTNWTRIVRTFTATSADAGVYGEMSIVYNDAVSDYYVYFSCFQIEEKNHATPYVDGTRVGYCPDISGYHNNLTVNGTPTLSTDSKRYNKSIDISGTTLLIGLNVLPTLNDFTISCWVKIGNTTSGELNLVNIYSSGHAGRCILGHIQANTKKFRIWIGGTAVENSQDFNLNQWYHLVATRSGSTLTLYIDGVSKGTATKADALPSVLPIIGSTNYNNTYALSSGTKISDVRIYATALSADDVQKLYKLGNV